MMDDKLRQKLLTNTTAHGLIDDAEVKAAFETLPTKALVLYGVEGGWVPSGGDYKRKSGTYRLRPDWTPPAEKMQPPWDALIDEIVCAARDKNGLVYGYDRHPNKQDKIWTANGGSMWSLSNIKFPLGEEDWDQSLVWRPGHEPEGK